MIMSDLVNEGGDFTDGLAQIIDLHMGEGVVGNTPRIQPCN